MATDAPLERQTLSQGDRRQLDYDFEESLGFWIVVAAQAFQKALNDELAPCGITFRQSQVLGWLALEGELSQVELAGRMMIEPATLVGVLDRMERDQLIRRVPAEGDRRRKVIQVLPAAQAVWQRVADGARRVRARAVEGIPPGQVDQIRQTLRQVLENLGPTE